jgi:selenocysteine-specific elongation factor
MNPRHYILGTAGHIDHGKTALVKALTGVDTDRLPEEKARGLTIDLGFAHFGDHATIIDVPGHEKFVKNMVAGVSTIDLVLFVVAADDGIMPQTREHLDILDLLQIRRGIIVLTKKDLVDGEWLALMQEDIRRLMHGTFLEKSPIIVVSSLTGEGIADLKHAIQTFPESRLGGTRPDRGVFWLPVDRAFSMKGFGTVVTGSVLSGETSVGSELEILPAQKKVRVRGLQRHGKTVSSVQTGDRAAINLLNVSTEEVSRGQVLTLPDYFAPSSRLNCRIRLLPSAPSPLRERLRVRLHLGTAEILARVRPIGQKEIAPGKEGYVQLILEKPAAARRLDPLVLRRYSPSRTIGGGVVLEAPAATLRRHDTMAVEKLRSLENEDPAELLTAQLLMPGRQVVSLDQLAAGAGGSKEDVLKTISALQAAQTIFAVGKRGYMHKLRLESLSANLQRLLEEFHRANPTRAGLRKAELAASLPPLADAALLNFLIEHLKTQQIIKEQEAMVALASHEIRLTPQQEKLRQQASEILYAEAFSTSGMTELATKIGAPQKDIEEAISILIANREIVRVEENIFIHHRRLQEARQRLVAFLHANKEITVSQFKELIGNASRKYAVPMLQYFDSIGVTERRGDVRILDVEEDSKKLSA